MHLQLLMIKMDTYGEEMGRDLSAKHSHTMG